MSHEPKCRALVPEAGGGTGNHAAAKAIEAEIPIRKLQYDYVSENYRSLKPTYFNTGCCCFSDVTLTGIEVEAGKIRLVLWKKINGALIRKVAEEAEL